ncbi:signal peptide peptidase SppA [Candidatus Sumerlaeota bacterium]|nr:signal peptide peptidase SppA [Candidatus Sumerlaeota bacterium]
MLRQIQMSMILALAAVLLNGCIIAPNLIPQYDTLHEVRLQKADKLLTGDKILLLDCSGIVNSEEGHGLASRPSMLSYVKSSLEKAQDDTSIKAVLLRIDSPGGSVTASDLIYREVMSFREQREKDGAPVIVTASMLDMAASGGYYIAMAADKVYAHPTTITGSIGVIAMFPNAKGLGEKIGLYMNVIKSGEKKDIGSMFREMTDAERELLQSMIDEMYNRFVEVVAANREMLSEADIRKVADGRIYTALEARRYELIDGVKYLDEVIDETKKLAELDDAKVVMYSYDYQSDANIYTQARTSVPRLEASSEKGSVSLIHIDADSLLQDAWPRFEYRYYPNY